MNVTPELVDSIAKLLIGTVAAVGGIVSTVTAFFTWKTRYELDKLYASTYRANEDGTPGPMRKHSKLMVKLFTRKPEPKADDIIKSENVSQ